MWVNTFLKSQEKYFQKFKKTVDFLGRSMGVALAHIIFPKNSQKFPKIPKISQKFPKIPKISQKFPKIPKISQDFPRFPKISQKFQIISYTHAPTTPRSLTKYIYIHLFLYISYYFRKLQTYLLYFFLPPLYYSLLYSLILFIFVLICSSRYIIII